ncbi:MAG TPA: toll/interleukin-1 receptor domain-containing protein [Dehalococcoidia bacterium]|nr:toll/interleukin-1 receptor domain-containing protein [Dehalococcoidia bacterium]
MSEPSCFVSYAHEGEAHATWCLRLAEDLTRNGVRTFLDQWHLEPGGDIGRFMESVSHADFILPICTPQYAQRADRRASGVGYETNVIVGLLLTGAGNSDRIVPVLRQGEPSTAVPRYLANKLHVDFRDGVRYDDKLDQLLRRIHGRPLRAPPPLGPAPKLDAGEGRPAPRGRIVVAGTGDRDDLDPATLDLCAYLGKSLFARGWGLVTCGWPGVDHHVAETYALAVVGSGALVEDWLTQVVIDTEQPRFPAGELVMVKAGPAEWKESVSPADAAILVGGLGGTMTTGLTALGLRRPVLPLAETGGDARKLHAHILASWDAWSSLYQWDQATFETLARPGMAAVDAALDCLDRRFSAGARPS